MVNWSKNGEGGTRAGEEAMTSQQIQDFKNTVAHLSFHPDDVPSFDVIDVMELVRELLVEELDWEVVGSHTVAWGDSGTPSRWELNVGPFNTITVDEHEGTVRVARTQFEGPWRTIVPRALKFLADNAS